MSDFIATHLREQRKLFFGWCALNGLIIGLLIASWTGVL